MPTPYTKAQIEQANSVNLTEYAKTRGYQLETGGKQSLHAKKSGGLYFFKNSNNYYHFATDKTGGIIDFVMQFENRTFLEAVEQLLGEKPVVVRNKHPPKEKRELVLPEKNKDYKRVYWYLCSFSGIDTEIVSKLMNEKKIYQQADSGNCVFVGYDENKNPKYCSKRGTTPDITYKGDETNSDKSYPFAMEGNSERLFVLESPIDVMSHAALTKISGMDYKTDHRISLGCLSDTALERYLKIHPEIKQIIFALDNDIDGKIDGTSFNFGQETALKYCEKYENLGFEVCVQIPDGKDFSEDLMTIRKIHENHLLNDHEDQAEI